MNMKKITLISLFLLLATLGWSHKHYEVFSPDKQLKVSVKTGNVLSYALLHKGDTLIYPSSISMTLGDGEVWGPNSKVRSVRNNTVNKTIASPIYKRAAVLRMVLTLFSGCIMKVWPIVLYQAGISLLR